MSSDNNFERIGQQLTTLFSQAIQLANVEVDDIIQSGECNTDRIDHQLDHMIGFCCDPDMLLVFKRLCRYYFTIDPMATGEHIDAYREMWDTQDALADESAADSTEAGGKHAV